MTSAPKPLVLIPHRIVGNVYVRELGRAYQQEGAEIVYGPENLFESGIIPDLVHLQWPEDQYRGFGDGPVERRVDKFLARLDEFKANGVPLAWTVHNLAPHEYTQDGPDMRAYRGVIERADLIVHHCERSVTELAERHDVPATKPSIVRPHGHYLTYADDTSRSDARQKLGIEEDAVVYLHFGALRGYKGVDGVLDAFARARVPKKYLLIAGQYTRGPGWRGRIDNYRMTALKRYSRNKAAYLESVPQHEIQNFLYAADAMVLGHRRGLNSGVAVLGMTFGKLVIGPDIGCIGCVLAEGRNFIYPAGKIDALTLAMEAVPDLDIDAIEIINRSVAAGWRWEDTARGVLDHFRHGDTPVALAQSD